MREDEIAALPTEEERRREVSFIAAAAEHLLLGNPGALP